MATDPLNPVAPLGLDWGRPQVAPTAPTLGTNPPGSPDLPTLEAMAAGPQIGNLEAATTTRPSMLDSASSARAERVANASPHRKALLGGDPAAIEREALAMQNQNAQEDLSGLGYADRLRVQSRLSGQMFDNAEAQTQNRTTGEVLSDTGLAVARGAALGVGSLATLGGAVIDPELGVSIAEGNQQLGDWINGFQSNTLSERSRLTALENELDRSDNETRRLEDIRSGDSEFIAGLKQVGRDFMSSIENFSEDPGQMGNIAAEGIGSLVTSVGVGGIATKLAGGGLSRVVSQELAEKAVMGGVIGLMEGGDAYGNAALEVMNLSEETLNGQSPEYRGLRQAGFSHKEAQIELAHDSGMGAAAIAVPAGAVAGALVGRFERAPLSFRGAGAADAVRTTAAQFGEETFQEGMSQFAGNVGLRWSGAIPDWDLTEGVGEAGAMGGIGGAGMAGGLRGATAIARAPADLGRLIVDTANRRNEENYQTNSPISEANLAPVMEESNAAQTRMAEAVATAPVMETPDPVRDRTFQEINFLLRTNEVEIASLRPNLQSLVSGKNRTDGLFSLVQELDGNTLDQDDKAQALLYVKNRIPTVSAFFNEEFINRAESFSPGMAADMDIMGQALMAMAENPRVRQALGMPLTQEQVDALTAASPENTAMAAEVAPTMVDPARAREALNHSNNGTMSLPQSTIRFLALSADLGDLIQEHKTALDSRFGEIASENTARTRADIFVNGRNEKQPSMVQHIDRIANSVRGGQMDMAQAEMEEFKLFADGQRNKLAAMEQSKANGDGNAVAYGVNTPDGWLDANHERAAKVFYARGKGVTNSENLLQNMQADSNAIDRAYIRMSEAFPELNAPIIEAPQGRNQGIKDLEIEAQDDQIREETRSKADKPYRPRVGTELPSAVGSLIEREVSEEAAQALATKIDLHMDDQGRVPRDRLTKAELKILRDVYDTRIQYQNIRIPEELAAETLAVRAAFEAEAVETPVVEQQVEEVIPEIVQEVATEESVIEEVKAPVLSDLVPNTSEKFKKGYALRKDGSKLLSESSPVQTIRAAIRNSDKGGVVTNAWSAILDDAASMQDRLNARLSSVPDAARLVKRMEDAPNKNGNTVLDFKEGRVLNLLNQETKQYDPQMAEIGGLAFVHWLLNERKPDRNRIEDTDVARIFKTDVDLVTQEMSDVVASGNYIENSVASLAETIEKFAGIVPSTDASRSDAGGIVLGLAAEIMAVAIDMGYVRFPETEVQVPKPNGPTEAWGYRAAIVDNPDILKLQKNMRIAGELSTLEKLIVPDGDRTYYVGEPPKKIDPTQMKNRETELTAREKKAIKNEQELPSYVNTPFVQMMKAFGREAWLDLLGYKPTTEDVPMNVKHKESVEGKNTSLVYGWEGVEGHVAEVDSWAAANQLAQDEVPSYWAYGISKVGRLQQRGFGPQADKQAREALTATVAVLDLNNPVQDDQFWMTIGQSIGIKTEKLPRAEVVRKAKAFMDQEPAQRMMGALAVIMDESSTDRTSFIEEFTADARELFGEDISAKGLHAMLANYRYLTTEDRSAFKHNLALESDGKTDGPINAMMNYLSGSFAPIQMKLMAMGGFFVNAKGKTLNDHFSVDSGKDLYEHTAALFENRLKNMQAGMSNDMQAMMLNTLQFLTIAGGVKFKDGKLSIGRNVVKNPLTVSVYGAGEAGIAGKVTREVMDTFYERLTESMTGMNDAGDIVNQLASLVNNKVVYSRTKNKYFVFKADLKKPLTKVDPATFALSAEQYGQLRDNIKVLFSDPLVDSINEMMGDTKKTMTLMQRSTQVQAIVAQEKFRQEVEKLRANKRPGEDLSDKEYWQVFKDIAPYGAQIYMPDQSANVGVSERLGAYDPDPNKRSTDMAASFDGRVTGNLKTLQPSDAGVKAAPFMVIMTGDAQMILRLAANGLERSLKVFDGIEMAADLMDTQSLEINKQVSEGWNQDTSAAVADSFENFMRQDPLKVVQSPEGLATLDWALSETRDLALSPEERVELMHKLQGELRNTSDEIRARKEALQEYAYSVDHMASAEQPYSNDKPILLGEDGLPLSEGVLVQRMNDTFQEKLSAIKTERGERQAKESKNLGLVSLVQEAAAAVRGAKGGAVSLSVSQMFEAVKTAKNSYQRQMLHAALSSMRGAGYTFHFGTREELLKLRDTLSPGIDQALDLGQTDPVGKHVYIASATTETALHEAIHAATIDKVFGAIIAPDNSTVAVKEAVSRLELLMGEFMGYDYSVLSGDQAGRDAQATIEGHLKKGTEAGRAYAINEFMAWSLSNQHLIETLTTTKVRNPLARLAQKVLRTIKGMLGMNSIPDSMYANIRFNTQILLNEQAELDLVARDALNHTVDAQQHVAAVMDRFNAVFNNTINNVDGIVSMKADARARIELAVNEVTDIYQAAGFNFSAQQREAFTSIQKAMMAAVDLHKPSLMRAQTMYRHMLDNLKPESFMVDPLSTNPNDIKDAQDKFNAVTGAYGFRRDLMGRSSLLGSFLALSQVDPQFRDFLQQLPPPKGDGASPTANNRFDEIVTEAVSGMMNTVSSYLYDGSNRKSSVGDTLDHLMVSLSAINQDKPWVVEKAFNGFMQGAENKSVEIIQSTIDGGIEALDKLSQKSKTRITKGMTEAAAAVLSLGSNRFAQVYADGITREFNKVSTPIIIRDFFAEMRGTHMDNDALHNMVGKVKYEVSATRQDFLEVLPHTILNQFKRPMSADQWSSLSRAIASTDLGNLMSRYSLVRVQELVSDGRKLNGEIASAKARLQAKDRTFALAYEVKAEALATYMTSGEITSKNLLTNAMAISRLLGERLKPSQVPDAETVNMIDDLVSLLALQKTQKSDKEFLASQLNDERDAMDFMLRYLNEMDRREKAKTTNARAQFNHIKGKVDTVRSGSDRIVVAEEAEFKRLARLGYVRMQDYTGDGNDRGKRAYFYSPVSGESTYHQGVMQTVQQTLYGVDAQTGYMVGNPGGRISGSAAKRIAKDLLNQKKDGLKPGEYLKPVYDDRGEMVAFERMLSPEMINKIKRDDHLATRIGAWRGRQAEEGLAKQYNTGLVNVLKDYWNDQKAERGDEFVNMADSDNRDRVMDHVWSVIPKEMKQEIKEIFGTDIDGNTVFMVRRDMLNDALGYPGGSIGDVFTGNNRISPAINKATQQFMTAIMGPSAYSKLVQTERLWQSAVTAAKTTIVIRSVVVPFANIVSNAVQMMSRRVPLRAFGKPLLHKVQETNTFLRNKVRLAELEAQGIAARGDTQRTAALRAKYRAIEDENKSLSIWPLIDRGEFATIADGLSEADKVVDNHKIMDMIEEQVNRLPEGVRTAGKYAIVSRDTALFKLLNRSVQYGDFIAKALVYDHKLEQGLSADDAYAEIRNEFVNYNLLPGRMRTTLESMGLLWFWNFKIRIVKVALDILRNNPLTALLWSMSAVRDLPIEGLSDGPLTDNLFAKGLEGKLPHSMGPGMVSMIYESNPWVRFIGS